MAEISRKSDPFRRLARIPFAVIFFFLQVNAGAAVSEFRCGNSIVTIVHEGESRTDLICEGARSAVNFMMTIGISGDSLIEVNVVDLLPAGFQNAFGCYDWRNDGIFILGSAACLSGSGVPRPFRVPNDEGMYKSYVAHEVAHALTARSFRFAAPSVAAQEYIAGVVQLSVMERALRSRILRNFSGDGYDAAIEINLLNYQLDPGRFAVEAYRHFHKSGHGPEFVEALLSGEIRLNDSPRY